jgi:acetyltransferase-like isoleucine patch superfamily enzyme
MTIPKLIFPIRLILNFRLKLIKSVYYSHKLSGNRGRRALLFFGNNSIAINRTANIDCQDNSKFYFNKPIKRPELFPGMLEMHKNSKIILKNNFAIHSGAHIIVKENAVLTLGSGYINRNCRIKCFKHINIGMDVAISENVTIWDSDVHQISKNSESTDVPINISRSINIGDHVWIGTNSIILKGVTIGSGSIIGAGSVVNKSIPPNCLAAGVPAKVIRHDVRWD